MATTDSGRPIDAYCYVDESKQNTGRYGGVCVVSVAAEHVNSLADELRAALGELREFKFNEMGDARHKRAALRILAIVLEAAKGGRLRVDTLTWDREDSRHKVVGRDEYANLARMLYHRIVHVLLQWPDRRNWHVIYDRQDGIDDKEVARTVNAKVRQKIRDDLTGVFDSDPEILFSEQVDSKGHVFVQVADLFAGLAVYLRDLDPSDYKSGSKAKRNRGEVIDVLVTWLAVNARPFFRRGEGLITERDTAINFWPYRPQGDYDRAPVRAETTEPRLVACVVDGCDQIVYDEYSLKQPRCPTHYSEMKREQEEAEQRILSAEKVIAGSHYCEQCFTRLTPTPAMKRVNQRTWEDEYRHTGCGGLLIELDPYTAQPDQSYKERDRSIQFERARPRVKLDRQNYDDDA